MKKTLSTDIVYDFMVSYLMIDDNNNSEIITISLNKDESCKAPVF